MPPNTLNPMPVTSAAVAVRKDRCAFRFGGNHWRRGSAFGS